MNKVQLRLVIALMSVALTGIIILQGYWIRHDLLMKSEQFDQEVMQALNEVVEQAEQNENMRLVVRNFVSDNDSLVTSSVLTDSLMKVMRDLAYAPPSSPPLPAGPPSIGNSALTIDSAILKRISDYRLRGLGTSEGKAMLIDSSIDIRIEKDIQQKEVLDFRIQERYMMDDTLIMNQQRRVSSKLKKLNSIMQKLTFQIVDPHTRIFDRISQAALDSLIRHQLSMRKINLPFEYGIFDRGRNNWYYSTPGTDTARLMTSPYQYVLFPNDVFKSNEVLMLGFRDRVNYLLGSMWPMLLSSMVFTAIIIFGFGYTIRTINRQKKLAMIKNDFINNMTHEFKTPIATIALANQSLRDPRVYQDESKLDFYTGVIKDENQRMLRQVENVLQMAQLDKGELKLKEEDTDLFEILDAAISSMKLTVEERGGNIDLQREGDEAPVSGDTNHLLNVFINILDNANKYSPDTPRISVHARKESANWRIDIRDQGIGMNREVQKRIFEKFYRAGTGNRHDVKGFGLGLSYVKAILEKHHGTISVDSEPGKGSTFTITIPVQKNNKV